MHIGSKPSTIRVRATDSGSPDSGLCTPAFAQSTVDAVNRVNIDRGEAQDGSSQEFEADQAGDCT